MMRKGIFFVAENDTGAIVASVYVELNGARGYFGMLAVAPSHQGLGLGGRMMRTAEDYCRQHGCRHMDIKVLSLRTELPPLYRKFGYTETGTEAFRPARPLKEDCHCIIMSKAL
jgi:ribosomal protein S18 acetylase RimI-like enzyme